MAVGGEGMGWDGMVVVVLTRHSRRCVFPYRRRRAPNWSGRTPGSQTPGVPATPSPRQRRTLRHRGLENGHSRPDGRRAKNAAKCSKSPLDSEDLVDEPQLQMQLRNLHGILYCLNHGTCRCTSTGASTKPRTVPVRSSRSAAQFAL